MGLISNLVKWIAVGGTVNTPEAENKVGYYVDRGAWRAQVDLDAADAEFRMLDEAGIVNGVPGLWSDEYILGKMQEIESSDAPDAYKYQALDNLYFGVCNNHAHGIAADVVETVARAMDKY